MPRNRKQKKTKQKKAKKDLNLDVRVIPRNKDAGVRRFEPEAEEWQLDNAQPKSSRVRCHSEKVPKTADGLSECMHDIMMRKLKKVEVELETNLSDTVEQLSSQFDELRAGIRQLNARIEVVALNMVSGLSFERTWSDEQNAFRAILARMLLDRSRRTAAEALGLSKWEDIREKGDAHVQIAFFKSTAEALPDSSPKKDMLLAIGNNPTALDTLLSRGNTIRSDYPVHHAERVALIQAVYEME